MTRKAPVGNGGGFFFKAGREFDACYIGMQMVHHMKTVDTLKVLERHGAGESKDTLPTSGARGQHRESGT